MISSVIKDGRIQKLTGSREEKCVGSLYLRLSNVEEKSQLKSTVEEEGFIFTEDLFKTKGVWYFLKNGRITNKYINWNCYTQCP